MSNLKGHRVKRHLLALPLVAAISVPLAGCGAVQQMELAEKFRAERENNERIISDNKAKMTALHEECSRALDTHDLDLIRDKVELDKAPSPDYVVSPPPFSILQIDAYPTAAEKKAIQVWAGLREACAAKAEALQNSLPIPTNVKKEQVDILRASANKLRVEVSSLVADLYQGKITYGQFAKKRFDVSSETLASARDRANAIKPASVTSGSKDAQAGNQEDPFSSSAHRFAEAEAAIQQFKTEHECHGPGSAQASSAIDELERLASYWTSVKASDPRVSDMRTRHYTASFDFAEVAKAKGCLDEADVIYRHLITVYSGLMYQSVRERAKLGIDDIREARRTAK